jgi:UDP-N-acetylglucosamine transferase subunit ALG13
MEADHTTLIVLGSGGHTAEMLSLLRTVEVERLGRRVYAVAASDWDGESSSHQHALRFERERGADPADFDIVAIPRARHVRQSWLTTPFTTALALLSSARLVWIRLPPIAVLLCNGPGTCLPLVAACHLRSTLRRLVGRSRTAVCFFESFACVHRLSLTGRILRALGMVTPGLFFAHWPELARRHRDITYPGRFAGPEEDGPERPDRVGDAGHNGSLLVTVGSTHFDLLVRAIDSSDFLQRLKRLGFRRLALQHGTGEHIPGAPPPPGFRVDSYRYKPSLADEVRGARVVVSHGGAGSVLEALSAGRRLVVVPNRSLMDDHQVQLAGALEERGYLRQVGWDAGHGGEDEVSRLREALGEAVEAVLESDGLRAFPANESPVFRRSLERYLPQFRLLSTIR